MHARQRGEWQRTPAGSVLQEAFPEQPWAGLAEPFLCLLRTPLLSSAGCAWGCLPVLDVRPCVTPTSRTGVRLAVRTTEGVLCSQSERRRPRGSAGPA